MGQRIAALALAAALLAALAACGGSIPEDDGTPAPTPHGDHTRAGASPDARALAITDGLADPNAHAHRDPRRDEDCDALAHAAARRWQSRQPRHQLRRRLR